MRHCSCGGLGEGHLPTEPAGARWDPERGWRELPPAPLEHGRRVADTMVGSRWVLWGGSKGKPARGEQSLSDDGAVYDLERGEWQPLPEAPLAPRQSAEALPAAGGLVVQRGFGKAEFDVRYDTDESDGRESASGGLTKHNPRFDDAARFDFDDADWAPAPPTDGTAADLDGDDPTVLAGPWSRPVQWDEGTWRGLDPPADGATSVVRAQGETAAINHDDADETPTRLGGSLRDGGTWHPLAEADVVRRRGPTVVPTDRGVLVWGGEVLRAPGEQAHDHEDGPWLQRADGAWLTLDSS